jgi:hypothetical protein
VNDNGLVQRSERRLGVTGSQVIRLGHCVQIVLF